MQEGTSVPNTHVIPSSSVGSSLALNARTMRRQRIPQLLVALLTLGSMSPGLAHAGAKLSVSEKLAKKATYKKPSAQRVKLEVRPSEQEAQLRKVVAGAKRYVPAKAGMPREQLLAELLEKHPNELVEVAGFAGR